MFPHPGLQHSGFWETLGVQPNMFPLPGLQHSGFWETMGVQSNMLPHPGLQHSGFWETLGLQPNMCNGEKGTLTFVHQSHQCTGPLGLGYGPPNATEWAATGWQSNRQRLSANGCCPGCDIIHVILNFR